MNAVAVITGIWTILKYQQILLPGLAEIIDFHTQTYIIIINFRNVYFFNTKLWSDVCPYEVPSHTPKICPLRPQTKPFHVILLTVFPSLPVPPLTFHPCHSTFLQDDTQSSTLLHFRCPNHLNLPRLSGLTTSTTLCIPKRLYKTTLLSILQRYIRKYETYF